MKVNQGIAICLLPFLAACGGDAPATNDRASDAQQAEASSTQDEPSGESGYRVIEVPDGGVLRGTVRFVGSAPALRTISVSDDAETCGDTRNVHGLRVGSGGGLMHSVVSLVNITAGAGFAAPSTPPVLDQRRCAFEPHVLLAPVGEVVQVLNNDPITHNIHTVAFANRPVNRAQPSSVRKIDVSFMVAEKVRVRCDMHEWMGAWIVVMDHPYHAVTDDSGGFVLENVPPGTYTMEVWHETLGAVTQEVTVLAGEESKVAVEMASTEER